MENAVATQATASLALGQSQLTQDQVALLKRTVCRGATDDEFQLFLYQCNRTRLDPFVKQIHAVKRWNPKEDRDVMVIQTGIDGYRLIAHRTGQYEGQTAPQWCGADGVWMDVWISEEPPKAARVGVWRTGFREPAYGVALWREYIQTYTQKGVVKIAPMWVKMGVNQIAKCAEALALRKAFPQELSGIHTDEEMEQASVTGFVGDPRLAATTKPPEALDDEERKLKKKARADLNKLLQPVKDAKAFAKARGAFQKEYGKDIWEEKTHHNDHETFMDIVHEHWARVQGDEEIEANRTAYKRELITRILACDNKAIYEELQQEVESTYFVQNDMEILDLLTQKGLDLGVIDDALFSEPEEAKA